MYILLFAPFPKSPQIYYCPEHVVIHTGVIGPKAIPVAGVSDFGLHDGTTNRSQRHVADFLLVLGLQSP
jgi:hypothetical protein